MYLTLFEKTQHFGPARPALVLRFSVGSLRTAATNQLFLSLLTVKLHSEISTDYFPPVPRPFAMAGRNAFSLLN